MFIFKIYKKVMELFIYYLSNIMKTIIIHIVKCGGGSLTLEVRKKLIFNNNQNKKFIILIRDPINRYISAFN